MTIDKKLFLSFGAALALTLITSVVALENSSSLGGQVKTLAGANARKLYLAGDINTAAAEIVTGERGILLSAILKDDAPVIEKFKAEQTDTFARMKKDTDEFAPLAETDEGRRLIRKIRDAQEGIVQNHAELISLIEKNHLETAGEVLSEKVIPAAKGVGDSAAALVARTNKLTADVGALAAASASRARRITMLTMVLFLVVGAVVVYVVREINSGLQQITVQLGEGANQVASVASQVASSSQSLAKGSSQQAASLQETSASTEEINAMARKNSENSRSGANLVTQSQQKFVETNQLLNETVLAMREINAQSSKISKIIKVIDGIAFQTNILALNAAVEAARAGEAGMGFAVVADEVRNLAQRSAQAARDTADLIEDSINKSNAGKAKVDQVTAAIQAIIEQSGQVKTLVDEVNLGSQEQARGIEQVGRAITQIEQVTQGAAASAEESAAAAKELTAQSEALNNIIERLTEMVGAGTAA